MNRIASLLCLATIPACLGGDPTDSGINPLGADKSNLLAQGKDPATLDNLQTVLARLLSPAGRSQLPIDPNLVAGRSQLPINPNIVPGRSPLPINPNIVPGRSQLPIDPNILVTLASAADLCGDCTVAVTHQVAGADHTFTMYDATQGIEICQYAVRVQIGIRITLSNTCGFEILP